jgi:hypothetical protein
MFSKKFQLTLQKVLEINLMYRFLTMDRLFQASLTNLQLI